MADDKITISVEVEGKADVEIKRLEKSIDSFTTNGQKAFSQFQGAFNSFIGNLASNVVTGAFNRLQRAAGSLFDTFIVDGVRAAQQQQEAINNLNAALQSAGTFSEAASRDIQDFASAIQAATTVGDELVLEGVALAQSFTRTAEEAKALTSAALDFAKGADLNFTEAIRRLGRAVQGSAADVANFAPEIRNLTKEQLAAGEATRIIAERFQGAAAAETRTFQGAVKQLTNLFGDLQESIGDAVIKNQSFTNVMNVANRSIQAAIEFVQKNADVLQEGFSRALQNTIGVAKIFLQAVDAIAKGVGGAINGIVALIASAIEKTLGFAARFSSTAKQLAKDAKLFSEVAFKEFERSVSDGILVKGVQALEALEDAAAKGFGKTTEEAKRASNSIREFGEVNKQIEEEKERLRQEASSKVLEDTQRRIELNTLAAGQDAFLQSERLRQNKEILEETLKDERLTAKDQITIRKNLATTRKAIAQQEFQAASDSLNALSTLQTAKTKELAILGKGAAIAQTTIDTYRGAQAAAASLAGIPVVGPALAAAAAAAFITAGLARVATIAGTPLAQGMTEVPPGFSGDTFPARLSSGERVVDRGTNQDLKAFLSGDNKQSAILAAIVSKLDNLNTQVVVNIGEENLVNVIQRGLDRGRVLAV